MWFHDFFVDDRHAKKKKKKKRNTLPRVCSDRNVLLMREVNRKLSD